MWAVEAALRETMAHRKTGYTPTQGLISLHLSPPLCCYAFLCIYLCFPPSPASFSSLSPSPWRLHTIKGLSSAPHTYRNTPRRPIRTGHELDIEPERNRERGGGGGRNEGGSRGAQGHQPSVTVESYFFPWPSAVDSELNTECAHCRARGQTQPPEYEEPQRRGGLRSWRTAEQAWRPDQERMMPKCPVRSKIHQRSRWNKQIPLRGRGHLLHLYIFSDRFFIHLLHCDDGRLLGFHS